MDRFNRVLWIVLAVLLLLAGTATALAGFGVLPRIPQAMTLLPHTLRTYWRAWGIWAWLGLAAAGLLLAVLGTLLIRGQFRPPAGRAMPDLLLRRAEPATPSWPDRDRKDAPATEAPGRTRVRAAAMVHGIERDLARHPRIRSASVRLLGDTSDPRLLAHLDVAADTDVTQLHRHLTDTLARFTTTTGLHPGDVSIVLSLTDRGRSRVS